MTMGLVGFAVLFAGIVAPQAATASTAALLTFVLPVAVAATGFGDRPSSRRLDARRRLLRHRLLAGVAAPWHDNLRRRLAAAVSAVARLADAWARGTPDPAATRPSRPSWRACASSSPGTPYPPTGAASGAVALSKLVGRVEWVAGNTAHDR